MDKGKGRIKKRTTAKSWFSVIWIVGMLLLLSEISVLATDNWTIDQAELLTDQEKAELNRKAEQIFEQYGTGSYVFIMTDLDGKTAEEYGRAYILDSGQEEVVTLVFDMDNRNFSIDAHGAETRGHLHSQIDTMVDHVIENAKNDQIFEACVQFLDDVAIYMVQSAEPYVDSANDSSQPYVDSANVSATTGKPSFADKLLQSATDWKVIGIAVVLSFIVTLIIALGSKGKVTITDSTYEADNSFDLTNQEDRYITTTVTSRKIEKNDSSGGGSSSGGSSGGGSFSSGGGSF